jgi:energy-coupling factor transporter transmembrane protein EcfT
MRGEPTNKRTINPLAKLLLLITLSVLVLLVHQLVFVVVMATGAIISILWYRVTNSFTRGAMAFALAIFVAQVLFNHTGDTLLNISVTRVTIGGVESGLTIAGKFVVLIGMSWVFVATTRSSELSSALISTGIPYRYAYLPSLAMHFVPTFQFELGTVREAQVTRGLRLDRSLRGLIRSVKYTTTPMLLSAMSKVNSLAASMTGRGFGAFRTRTLLNPLRMTAVDAVVVIGAIIAAAIVILIDRRVEILLVGLV